MRNFLTITTLLLLFNCTNSEKNKSSDEHDQKMVFYYNEKDGISSLDPAESNNIPHIWICNQLYNGLVQLDDSLNVLSCIAKYWEISEDGTKYTFYLRNDVYFHDNPCFPNGKGRKVTAYDFEFSFNRLLITPNSTAASLLSYIDRSERTNFRPFQSINDSTFVIYLKQPYSVFLNILTMKYFSVIPYEAIDYYKKSFHNHAVGTGPFMLKQWDEGNKLILVKNPNYFEKDEEGNRLPYLDAVSISFIRDKETAFIEFLNGKLDMISGADAININEVLDKSGMLNKNYASKCYLQKGNYLKTDYIGLLVDEKANKNSPLLKKPFRQALNYAIDRERLVKYFRNGVGMPAVAGFIPKGFKSFDTSVVKGYHYNPDKVKQLLKEAGYPDGKGLPEIVFHITEDYKEQASFLQSQWKEFNIPIKISIEQPSVFRQATFLFQYEMFKKNWVVDYIDEENFFSLFYSNNFVPAGFNYTHFKNVDFDLLYEKALRTIDEKEKIKIYQEMDKILIDEAPIIPLFYDEIIRLVNPSVEGLTLNPMNLLNLKTVKKISKPNK
ncbi:MAG: peptide ABC transporter substrate-binding protein [Bacteroidia bacterium]|nr:MAG: peptide ABC transporter substrate-binding protein [Bacteroidia bacterium]